MAWSTTNSTVFGAATSDGRVEIWDISKSTLKPVLMYKVNEGRLSRILFSPTSPVVVVGGSTGAVHVFRLEGVERGEVDAAAGRLALERSLFANTVEHGHDG